VRPQQQGLFSGIFVCSQSGYHPYEDIEKVAIINSYEDLARL
jgi:hypothetical protein